MKPTTPLCLAAALFCSAPAFAADAKKKPTAAPPPAPAAPAKADPAAAAEAKPYVLPEVVATVEGQDIKKDELEKAFTSMLSSQGVTPEVIPPGQRGQAYHMILDELIVDKILTKRSAELPVADTDVATAFDKFKTNFGSPEELKSQLEKSGQTEEKVKEDIRNSLREQHWLEAQVKDNAPVTDAEAQDFYEKNPKQFERPEEVRASHILIKVAQDAKPADVVEKEKKAEAIIARVKAGEDFGKLATELSEDPSAKENAGDLNFFTKERMVPEFADAAFAMKKDQISEPVRSQFGYHVIKLTDRKPGEKLKLEQVKPKLVAYLTQQKKEEAIGKVLKDLRDKAEVKVNLPKEVSEQSQVVKPGE